MVSSSDGFQPEGGALGSGANTADADVAPPTVSDDGETYLVLVENEVNAGDHDWDDETGSRYHFPNIYKNRIRPGARFVYYRGSRLEGGGRADPVYFGSGVIGDVELDPETEDLPPIKRRWIAKIADYSPFPKKVPFRSADGTYAELLLKEVRKNWWGVGVRSISGSAYRSILQAGGLVVDISPPEMAAPLIATPTSASVTELWRPSRVKAKLDGSTKKVFDFRRLSRRSKVIGDAAEKLFFERLCASEPDASRREMIRWVAREGLTPGYDIEDARDGKKIAYEVKGTTLKEFLSIEMTFNELECAKELQADFVLVLVTGVLGSKPRIAEYANPAKAIVDGTLAAQPTMFSLRLNASA